MKKVERYKGRKSMEVSLSGGDLSGVFEHKQQVHVTLDRRYIRFLKERELCISSTVNSLIGRMYEYDMAQQREAP